MSLFPALRIGQGFDVHRFGENRKLILGGLDIPHSYGLVGHSDADVLLHAITDAVLGALAWGDIGQWFSDSDPEFAGADSKKLFLKVWKEVRDKSWELVNCDCVLMLEEPKLQDYKEAMQKSIAELFGVDPGCVSVKATTTERLGFIGRGEGIAASAVLLLSNRGN